MVKVKCFYPTKILNFSFGFPKIISACSTYPTWWPVSIPSVNAWSSPTSKRVCSGFAIAATRTSSSFLRTTRILAGWRRPVCWTSTPWLRLTSLATLALWVHGPGLIVSFTFHVESFSMFECKQLLREAERKKKIWMFFMWCVQVRLPPNTSDDVDEDPTGNKALWDRGLLNGASQKVKTRLSIIKYYH